MQSVIIFFIVLVFYFAYSYSFSASAVVALPGFQNLAGLVTLFFQFVEQRPEVKVIVLRFYISTFLTFLN